MNKLPNLTAPVPGKRRRLNVAQKLLLLDQAEQPGETLSSIARQHGLSVSLMFRWRRLLRGGPPRPSPPSPSQPNQEVERLREQVARLQDLLGQALVELERVAGSSGPAVLTYTSPPSDRPFTRTTAVTTAAARR